MSQNNPNQVGHASGADAAGANRPTEFNRLGETDERRVNPTGARSPAPVPDQYPTPAQPPTATVPATASLSFEDLRAGVPETPGALADEGLGPKVVILHHGVTGAGRAMFQRGRVVRLSLVVGDTIFRDEQALRREVARLTSGPNPAIREANEREAGFTQVTFLEDTAQIANALTEEQARAAKIESENARLKDIIDTLGLDPNMTPDQVRAKLAARAASTETTTAMTSDRAVTPVPVPPTSDGPSPLASERPIGGPTAGQPGLDGPDEPVQF